MSLNPVNKSYSWNFSNQNREGYMLELIGTVVSIQEIQAREFSTNGRPGRPRFWDNGNPVMNIRMGFATEDGSFKSFTFAKAGKKQSEGKKPSVHMSLYNLFNDMNALVGKTIKLTTWPAHPETGQKWCQGNPRLFSVEVVPDVTFSLNGDIPAEYLVPELLANDGASGGQPVQQQQQPVQPQYQQPQYQPQYQQPAMQQPVQQYQQPQYQQPVMQQPMQQPQYQQPAMQQPVQQYQVMPQQQTTAPIPDGMDPAIASAMQSIGATNIQPYDDPF